MKLKDLAFVLNKLNEEGYGEVELYTDDEEPIFHMNLNGINGDDFKQIWPINPFKNGIDVNTFNISKECCIDEENVKISNCYDIHKICMETRKLLKTKEAYDQNEH